MPAKQKQKRSGGRPLKANPLRCMPMASADSAPPCTQVKGKGKTPHQWPSRKAGKSAARQASGRTLLNEAHNMRWGAMSRSAHLPRLCPTSQLPTHPAWPPTRPTRAASRSFPHPPARSRLAHQRGRAGAACPLDAPLIAASRHTSTAPQHPGWHSTWCRAVGEQGMCGEAGRAGRQRRAVGRHQGIAWAWMER